MGRSPFGATLFVVLGIVAMGALVQCPSGSGQFGSCLPGMASVVGGAADEGLRLAAPGTSPAAFAASTPSPRRAVAWVDALIAGSFDMLPAEPGHSRVAAEPDVRVTGSATIRPAAVPVPQNPPPALVVAWNNDAAKRQEYVPAEPSLLVALERLDARISAWNAAKQAPDSAETAEAVAATEAAPVPAPRRPALAAADSRTVGGKGVTVRSGPSKSNGSLFALASGQKVTIMGRKRGWLHIVDERGRSGWAYSSYFRPPKT